MHSLCTDFITNKFHNSLINSNVWSVILKYFKYITTSFVNNEIFLLCNLRKYIFLLYFIAQDLQNSIKQRCSSRFSTFTQLADVNWRHTSLDWRGCLFLVLFSPHKYILDFITLFFCTNRENHDFSHLLVILILNIAC